MGTYLPKDPRHGSRPAMRASDAEREHVAELLQMHFAEGRIDADELQERLETTYAARTRADLVHVLEDLPMPQRTRAGLRRAPGGANRSPFYPGRYIALAICLLIILSFSAHHVFAHLLPILFILLITMAVVRRFLRNG